MAVLPAAALYEERPAALGWQMYAGVADLPTVKVLRANGSHEERPIGSIASGFRPEIDYFEPVARFLCSKDQEAVAVQLSRQRPLREEVFQCATF